MNNYPDSNAKFLKIYNKNNDSFPFFYDKSGSLDKIYYAWGEKYYGAAEYITDSLLVKGNQQIIQLDSYFLPLAFLYRQSLELTIKAIIIKYKGEEYAKLQIKESFHDLQSLLDALEPVLQQYGSKERETGWLKNYVKSVADFDEASDSFRYPYKIVRENRTYRLEYVFENRADIDLITMVHQFRLSNAFLLDIYKGKLDDYIQCDSVCYEFMKRGGAYYYKAVIGKGYDTDQFSKYIRGYDEVADILKDDAEKFFLPICYLKRNCIELNLKNMYMRYSYRQNWITVLNNIYECKHRICKLWDLNMEIVMNTKSASNEEFDLVKKYLKDIHAFDTDASHFRYPTDKYLKLYGGIKKYDGQNMIDYISAVLNAINGIDMYIDDFYYNTDTARRFI